MEGLNKYQKYFKNESLVLTFNILLLLLLFVYYFFFSFQIVGNDFNTIDDRVTSRYFETIYSLLDHVSPEYRNSFGDALLSRLQSLKDQQLQLEREILNWW